MTITKRAALLLMTVAGFAGLLNAQVYSAVKTQVPFAFVANGKTMPAGECTITIDVNGRTVLSINSGEQHVFALPISDQSPHANKKAALEFRRYGDRYFLIGVRRESGSAYQLPASEAELELQARGAPGEALTLLASSK